MTHYTSFIMVAVTHFKMENIPTVYYVYKSVFYVFPDMGGKDQRDKSAKESLLKERNSKIMEMIRSEVGSCLTS